MNLSSITEQLVEFGIIQIRDVQFKFGLRSPVYLDNRRLPFYPVVWNQVIAALTTLIEQKNLQWEVLAGMETAGIPHSAALAFSLKKPSVFVRKQAKAHGLKQLIEGGEVCGRSVLLLEDHITTGGSALAGIQALREAGAHVTDCISITSYDFPEAVDQFAAQQVRLHSLLSFQNLLAQLSATGLISAEKKDEIQQWHQGIAK